MLSPTKKKRCVRSSVSHPHALCMMLLSKKWVESSAMGRPHAVVIPFPAQGHVRPLIELSYRLADRGFLVTFVNTEFAHDRIMGTLSENYCGTYGGKIRFETIPDGMDPGEPRTNFLKFSEVIYTKTPGPFEKLIRKINGKEDEKISCVIADGMIGWLLGVAKKLNIRTVGFWPASAWFLAIVMKIPLLMENGVIDARGFSKKDEPISISKTIPTIKPEHLCWLCLQDPRIQERSFKLKIASESILKDTDHILINSSFNLESPAFELIHNAVPIGPLISPVNHSRHQPFSFWKQDLSCLSWLNDQPDHSVVYVSFGSYTLFNKSQIHELALGLENSGLLFLWVSRPDLMDLSTPTYPDGFVDRVSSRCRIVGWAPQQEVLSHPSIACFMTHCGWNSIMEGLWNGAPLLCWPYFADQYQNQTYVVEVWKIGIGLERDKDGIVKKEEIEKKLKDLLDDKGIKGRANELKDKVRKSVMKDGDSSNNFEAFINSFKGQEVEI